MAFQFTPLQDANQIAKVPFFEDARADYAPFYGTTKAPDTVQAEIVTEVAKLGGYAVYFVYGAFQDGKQKRHGYEVRFMLNGTPGMFRVAGLPMKAETDKKRDQVLAQALCICREWVKGMVTTKIFMPGTEPLAQYLLVDPQGNNTITDWIISKGKLPELAAKADDVIEVKAEVLES